MGQYSTALLLICLHLPLKTMDTIPRNKSLPCLVAQKTVSQSTQPKSTTLKTLAKQYGAPVAYALYLLDKDEPLPAEKRFVQNLKTAEKLTLLKELVYPNQIGNAAKILLPDEILAYIAYCISKQFPELHYKKLASSKQNTLQGASMICFNPHPTNKVLFTLKNILHALHNDGHTAPFANANIKLPVSKMVMHPSDSTMAFANRNGNLALYQNDCIRTFYGAAPIKDFALLPNNTDQVLVFPTDKVNTAPVIFDCKEKRFSIAPDNFPDLSPQTHHIATDPHHPGIIAQTEFSCLRIIDTTNNDVMKNAIKVPRNTGKCLFDPHHPDILAYASGRYLRILNLKTKLQCVALAHKSSIVDFDFDPHTPYELMVTQKNGDTIKWGFTQEEKHSLKKTMKFLKTRNK